MARPLLDKLELWRDRSNGIKSRLHSELKSPVVRRNDVPQLVVTDKSSRADLGQRLRLQYYPSIDIPKDSLYAGFIEGELDDAQEFLRDLGFRSNPTAYVEVTEEDGPDDGSYARNVVSETGRRVDVPTLGGYPGILTRTKEQNHVVMFVQDEIVEFLAHKEPSAWLQPARHLALKKGEARRGVRDFRDLVYDETGSELPGKQKVQWEVSH